MKFSEYQDELYSLDAQIANLQQRKTFIKATHAIGKYPLCDGYTFSGYWRDNPIEGISYGLTISDHEGIVCEVMNGDFYKRKEISSEVKQLVIGIKSSIESWLQDKIDWPFDTGSEPF